MIFSRTWQQVLDGTKTQTRRLVHLIDYCSGVANVRPSQGYEIRQVWRGREAGRWGEYVHASWPTKANLGRLKWEVGRTYAVQPGRGKKAVGRIRITGIRREWLTDICETDAMAEGIKRRGPWYEIGHLIGFSARETFRSLWDSIHRKGNRWVDNPEVWVLEFVKLT